jgi:hypothetical protein
MTRFVDTTGNMYGKLTVLQELPSRKLKCKCECGVIKTYYKPNVMHGKSTSCGCNGKLNAEKHGLSKHPLYKIWQSMKRRCYNPNEKAYPDYGGRGIRVCKKWKKHPENFIEWAESKYKPGLEIDRINNDGNYSPNNCRFVTPMKNSNNRRNNRIFIYRNKKGTLAELVKKYSNHSYDTVYQRLKRGYHISAALKAPI